MKKSELKKVELSVIILSYNTKELLKRCLESLLSAISYQLSAIEVIVVDNGSTDGSVEMLWEWRKGILSTKSIKGTKGTAEISSPAGTARFKLIESKTNLGFAGGNNLGLKKARGRYILFLNSDTEVFAGSLKKAVKFMESDEKIGAMTPKALLYSGQMDPDCHRGFPTPWASLTYFLGLEKLFPKNRLFGQYHKLYEDLNKPHEIDAGFGTFMLIRREVYEKIGGWDESYFFYGEDLDYFYRIRQAGWKVMFYPEPLLNHHKGGSSGLRKESRKITPASKETRIKTARASIKAMEIFYQKFYQEKYPVWLTFLVLTAIRIKGFFRILNHRLK